MAYISVDTILQGPPGPLVPYTISDAFHCHAHTLSILASHADMFQNKFIGRPKTASLSRPATKLPCRLIGQAIPVPGQLHRGQLKLFNICYADPESVRA